MKFTVKDCDPTTGEADDEGYEDEYVLEDLEVTIADHIQKVMKLNFEAAWDEVGMSSRRRRRSPCPPSRHSRRLWAISSSS